MDEETEDQSSHAPGWCSLMGEGAFPGEESHLAVVGILHKKILCIHLCLTRVLLS